MFNAYRIVVEVPLLSEDKMDELFGLIGDLVHDWEPEDRKNWDAFVHGHCYNDDLFPPAGHAK